MKRQYKSHRDTQNSKDKTKRFISTPNYAIHFLPTKKFSIFIQTHSVTTQL